MKQSILKLGSQKPAVCCVALQMFILYITSMLKVSVTKAKSVECLIIELLKVIAVPMAAVITEDAWVLVCELFVKVGCVLKQDELSSAASKL